MPPPPPRAPRCGTTSCPVTTGRSSATAGGARTDAQLRPRSRAMTTSACVSLTDAAALFECYEQPRDADDADQLARHVFVHEWCYRPFEMTQEWTAVERKGKPKRGTEPWCVWGFKAGPARLLGRIGAPQRLEREARARGGGWRLPPRGSRQANSKDVAFHIAYMIVMSLRAGKRGAPPAGRGGGKGGCRERRAAGRLQRTAAWRAGYARAARGGARGKRRNDDAPICDATRRGRR